MPAAKKRRVYEAAKDMGMSSEALVNILRSMSIDVKSHMSSIGEDVVEQVRQKLARDKEAVNEEEAKKREKAAQAARAEAQRRPSPAPGTIGAGLQPPRFGKKKRRSVDEAVVRASVKRTLAEMEGGKRRRHHRQHEEGAAVGVEVAPRLIYYGKKDFAESALYFQRAYQVSLSLNQPERLARDLYYLP